MGSSHGGSILTLNVNLAKAPISFPTIRCSLHSKIPDTGQAACPVHDMFRFISNEWQLIRHARTKGEAQKERYQQLLSIPLRRRFPEYLLEQIRIHFP